MEKSSDGPENKLLLQLLVDGLNDHAVILLDAEGNVRAWNPGAQTIKGYTADEIVGRHFSTFYTKEDIAVRKPEALMAAAITTGRYEETGLRVRKDGTIFHAHVILTALFDDNRRLLGFGKLTRDVSIQVRAAASEARLRRFLDAVVDTMIDGLIVIDVAGTIQMFNGASERIFGYAADEAIGRNIKMLMPQPTRGAHDGYLSRYQETGKRSIIGTTREVNGLRKDGTTLPISIAIGEAKPDGETIFVGVVHDLTAQKAIESELLQAQRLDAIGQLTGGIAHDFNNLLMVIMATAEDLIDDLASLPDQRRKVSQILGTAEGAADLTRQLLAFARKQPLRPQATALNDIVVSIGAMLSRTLGEHIEIDSILSDELWAANIDRVQFEASLVNLCINARDAMPGGGRLMIETQNAILDEEYQRRHPDAAPGEYVMLAISDTGTGIPAHLLDRVFEPFFTTKGVGKGTGLGLSMVYGFIKQSHGHVRIYSEEGHGTTIRLYLPRVREAVRELEQADAAAPPMGDERILVVEDDKDVRSSVVRQLRSLGYAVGEASDGAAGLQRLAEDPPYDLLLTDVVMPGGINGRLLADRAKLQQPGLHVLFMSGYTDNAIIHHGRLDPGVRLLSKPFRKIDLARAIRAALAADA